MAGEFSGYGNRQGQKKGGIHKADPDGGRYKRQNPGGETDVFLIKRDTNKGQNDIAEYLAASVFQQTANGYGAEVALAKNNSKNPENPENKNAFLVSKYFKQYKDFFQDRSTFQERGSLLSVLEATPIKSPQSKLAEKNNDGTYRYTGYEKALVTSLLVGDFSVHSGNMGVIGQDTDQQKKLVRIDFGAAFRDFSPDINPYKSVKNRLGQEKNYFLRDHPKERIISKEFSDELRKVGSENLDNLIAEKWADIEKNFDDKTVKSFGNQLGLGKGAKPDEIKEHLATTFHKRQQSFKDMANEIDISLAMEITNPVERTNKLQEAVDRAVKESPDHFQYILDNPKKSQLQIKFSQEALATLEETLDFEKTKTINPLLAQKQSGDAIVLADQAPANAIGKPVIEQEVSKMASLNQVSSSNPISQQQSSAMDPVDVIRQEIINKQTEILKNTVAAINPEIAKLSTVQFKDYLKEPDGKKLVAEALENPVIKKDFEQAIQKAEISGYKKFNDEFSKIAKPVTWDAPSAKTDEKLQVVKNSAGEEICTLKEKTVKLFETTKLADGTTKEQEINARTIEFPPSIKPESGPMHASFALKNENGQNMPAKDAVYFTVHYDKSGKLTEVSSPQPVKFGTGNPEVAFIERDGHKYTLPVTKDQYQGMMQQVAANKGMGFDLSQKEALAADHVITNAVESTQIKDRAEAKPHLAPLAEEMSKVTIPPLLPKEEAVKKIDEVLKDRKPEEVVEMLKNETSKGRDKIVDLVVESTKADRVNRPADVPKLTSEQYKLAYAHGMKEAAPGAKTLVAQGNIHRASAKLLPQIKDVPPALHASTVKFNTTQLNKNHGR